MRAAGRIVVRGIVQGVGFRPFVYRLANELGLDGGVRNDGAGVTIEVAGDTEAIASLIRRLAAEAPPLARVDAIEHEELPVAAAPVARGFAVRESARGVATTAIPPDAAICPDCW